MALGISSVYIYIYIYLTEGNTDAAAEAKDLIRGLLEAAVHNLLRSQYLYSQLY